MAAAMGKALTINVSEQLSEYQIAGYYNDNCKMESLLINSDPNYSDDFSCKVNYPADSFRHAYPEGDSWPLV